MHHATSCNLHIIDGSETYNLTKALEQKLQRAQKDIERIMIGLTWRDRKRASWIMEQTKVEDILTTIKRKRWTWAGYIIQLTYNRWTASNHWVTAGGYWYGLLITQSVHKLTRVGCLMANRRSKALCQPSIELLMRSKSCKTLLWTFQSFWEKAGCLLRLCYTFPIHIVLKYSKTSM